MFTLDNFKNEAAWKSEFGLLPVPLFRDTSDEQPLVLFNGARGNFCIDWGCYKLGDETRNFSWSSNISHYISATEGRFEVQSWDQGRSSIERYNFASVASNFEKFHQYLEKKSTKQDQSIVSHVIRTFRKIRATLGAKTPGEDALRAFLYLLGSLADNVGKGNLDISRWRLSARTVHAAELIRENDWISLSDEILFGRPIQGLKPVIELLLRHASGQLFQDAHYEAVFINPGQLSFDGFLVHSVTLSQNKKGVGIHFTPPALARAVAEEVLKSTSLTGDITIFDPACGSGEFLKEILRQLKLNRYMGNVRLIGWDISSSACEMANFTLAWESRDINCHLDIEISNKDSLHNANEWPVELDVVIMNPPFVSWQDMQPSQRSIVTSILGDKQEKRSDMSHAFIWKASQSLRENGILGTVIPASFFTNESANSLRNKLNEQLHPQLLARLGSHQLFSNALVDTAIYVGKKQAGANQPFVALWADHRAESNASGLRALRRLRTRNDSASYPVVGDGYSIYLDDMAEKENNWSPRPYESKKLGSNVAKMPRVSEMFDVKQGVRTGHNKVYLIPQGELYILPEPERKYFRPCVINESIKCGFLFDTNYVFYPYGDHLISSEAQLSEVVPHYYKHYLLPEKPRLLSRPRVNPAKWWELSEHRAWQVNKRPKLISTYFGGKGSFAWDDSGDYVVVQGYGWLSKRKSLNEEIAKAYLAVLDSELFYRLLTGVSNSLAGGQWDLSKKYVEKIALPDLTECSESTVILDQLSKIGSRIHAGLPCDEQKLEVLVKSVYRVDE